jgi:hypothetical protein
MLACRRHDDSEREFREWSSLVSAESTLRRAIEERNPLAITYARQLANLANGARRQHPPMPTDGSDPF